MRKIIIICSLLLSGLIGFSQVIVNRAGASNTVSDARLQAQYNLFTPRYNDTTAANVTKGVDSCGAIIYTRNPASFWRRDCYPSKHWTQVVDANNFSTIITNTNITNIHIANDSLLIICNGAGVCDTTIIHADIVNINSFYLLNDSTIVVCDATATCDTVIIAKQPISTYYQNGIGLAFGAPNIVEFGASQLVHNTTLDGGYYTMLFQGRPTYEYPFQFSQIQAFGVGTGVASFLNAGNSSGIDYGNTVRLGVNYTSSFYPASPNLNGYMGDKIGYMVNTNFTGAGSFGLRVDNQNSKYSGILLHSLDTTYSDAITFFGGSPPHSTFIADIANGHTLEADRIMTLFTNKNIRLYGYDSLTRNDGALTKALGTDAFGNVILGTVSSGGRADEVFTSSSSITLSTPNYYIFNGASSETFTLPASPDANTIYNIKSIGSGSLVVSGSGNDIFDSDSAIANYLLLTGDAVTMEWNGTYWAASNNVKKIHSKTIPSSTSIDIDVSEGYPIIDIDLQDSAALDILNAQADDMGFISVKNINGSTLTFHSQALPLNPIAGSFTNIEWRKRGNIFVFTSTVATVAVNTTTSYDADAQIYFNAIAAAGATLTTEQKDAINTFVLDEKAGGRWTKTDFYYPNLGLTSGSEAINLKSPGTFNQTFNGSWSFTSNGSIPNGSDTYSNTGWNPSTQSTLNSTHFCIYTNTPIVVGVNNNRALGGVYDGGTADALYLYPYYSGNMIASVNCPFAPLNQVAAADGDVGFYLISRVASGNFFMQHNATQTTKSVSSTGIPNGNLYIGDVNGSADKSYQNICFAAGGDGLTTTEASARQAAVQTLMTAIGR